MLNGHLRSRDTAVQRKRLRESIKSVDSGGIESRLRTTISVPCPNFIWHLDGNHKLIRWKLVEHGAMDGYRRMLMFLQCSNNNRSETVKQLFSTAIRQFGRPLHIRTDLGGENVLVWEENNLFQQEALYIINALHVLTGIQNKNCSHVYAPNWSQ